MESEGVQCSFLRAMNGESTGRARKAGPDRQTGRPWRLGGRRPPPHLIRMVKVARLNKRSSLSGAPIPPISLISQIWERRIRRRFLSRGIAYRKVG
jgi:hypothetical protein